MSPPPPGPVRTAVVALGLVALLALVSGGFTTVAMALLPLLDPLLGGDLAMPLTLAGTGLALTVAGAGVPVAAAASVRERRPAGRPLVALVGTGLCLTPLLPLGAWLIYVAYGHPEVDAWYGAAR